MPIKQIEIFIFCLAVALTMLLTCCGDSSNSSPACKGIIVSGFANLTTLPIETTATAAVDWRAKGMVTQVKDEGSCHTSWAFGITAFVESYNAINTGMLRSLSEQQLIDCDAVGNACFASGDPIESLKKMIAQGGLQAETSYPYTGVQGACQFDAGQAVATIPGAGLVPPGDEESLKAYVDKTGPVLAFIDDCHPSFTKYKSGIYYEPACSSSHPTRAVVIVGYGENSGQEYWIVRTSLGTQWGENGYIYMSRNRENNCGIASFALSPANLPLE